MQIAQWLLFFSLLAVALAGRGGPLMLYPHAHQVPKQQLHSQTLPEPPKLQPLPVQQTQKQKQRQTLAKEEPIVRLQHAFLHLLLLGREPRPEDMQVIKEEVLEQLQVAVDTQQLPTLHLEEPQMQQLREVGLTLGRVLEEAAEAQKEERQRQDPQVQDPQVHDPQMQGPQARIAIDISDLVETIREIIRNGSVANNIPVLDPFTLEHIQLLDLQEDDAWKVKAELSNLEVTGLAKLNATLDYTPGLRRQTFKIYLTLPEIVATGNYSFDALLGGEAVHLFGSGPFELIVTGVDIDVTVKFSTSMNYEGSEVDFRLESIKFWLTGLLEGGLLDDILSLGVTTLAVPAIELLKPNLTEIIANAIDDIIGPLAEEISIKDVICTVLTIPIFC